MTKQKESNPRGNFSRKITAKQNVPNIRPATIRSIAATSHYTHLQYDDGERVIYEEDVLELFNSNPLRTSPDREEFSVSL